MLGVRDNLRKSREARVPTCLALHNAHHNTSNEVNAQNIVFESMARSQTGYGALGAPLALPEGNESLELSDL